MIRVLIKDMMLICTIGINVTDLNQMTVHKGHYTQLCFTEQDKLTRPREFKMNVISKLGE